MTHHGLSTQEARARLVKHGYNEIKESNKVSIPIILLRQIKKNFVFYLLAFAMITSFFVGKHTTAYTIMAVIVAVILTGFIQEYKAERSIRALRNMLLPVSIVIRNGKEAEVASREIVPGDILVLRSGEKIPADCVILEESGLSVNESILTGESKEIRKSIAKSASDYSKENIIYMGTFLSNGRCLAQVIHTGMNTEFGKIANLISKAEKEIPLQIKVNQIAKYMATIAAIVSILTGLVMLSRSLPLSYEAFIDILIVVIALSVSAFPEGFPVVLTTTLATGAYNMAKKNAIVNRLSIIETLGETTVICSDKTGTITKGEMSVKKIYTDDEIIDVTGSGYSAAGEFILNGKKIKPNSISSLKTILKASVLCNDSRIEKIGEHDYKIIGTATEGALMVLSAKAGLFKDDINALRVEEIPFNSQRKIMSVLCKEGKSPFVYVKGAPEVLLKKCDYIQKGERRIRLTKDERENILSTNKEFTKSSFRTLGIAFKEDGHLDKNHFEDSLVFLGLVAMEDSPRDDVRESIAICRSAGIKVKMITGDSRETANAIATEIGLVGKTLEGEDLDKLTDTELANIVNDITIFARVRPEHKIRIVKALKANKEIVTMTGDGVNDAPALKEAHIGVAMGKNGTDVSKEAADLVLKDDRFSTIVEAVAEGRTIFNNIRKFVTYVLSCNFAELFVIFLGILFGLPLPLLAIQILFMNLVTDDLPAITLGFNPRSGDVMKRAPRKGSGILTKDLIILLFITGTIMGLGTLIAFAYSLYGLNDSLDAARTTALVTLIFFEITNAFNFRSFRKPNFARSLISNKYLVYASIVSIAATVLIIYTPLNSAFGTTPIGAGQWIMAFVIALSVSVVMDILKTINNKKRILNVD